MLFFPVARRVTLIAASIASDPEFQRKKELRLGVGMQLRRRSTVKKTCDDDEEKGREGTSSASVLWYGKIEQM